MLFPDLIGRELDRLRERLAGERVALESFFAAHRDVHTA